MTDAAFPFQPDEPSADPAFPFQPDEPSADAASGAAAARSSADPARSSADLDERESAYGLLQRGYELLASRHFAQAAIVLERAARLEPGKASILEGLGRAWFNSGQHARAAEAFEQCLDLDPSAHYAHFALGQSLKKLGRLDAARTHLRLAVALSPTSELYRGALARVPAA